MKPFEESSPNHYSRLFPPAQLPVDRDSYCDALSQLGAAMIDEGSRVAEKRPEILIDCGYTYFGQLVAHDLTKDVSSLDEAWHKEPNELGNLHKPKLDLEALHAGGSATSPELYKRIGSALKLGSWPRTKSHSTSALANREKESWRTIEVPKI